MAFIYRNPNPRNKLVGDCVIRAISIVSNQDWDDVFLDLMLTCYMLKDIPSSNQAWSTYLHKKGYRRYVIPDTCPDCYTIEDFTKDHPEGKYIVHTGSHVVAVIDGDYYDTWHSGEEIPIYYWKEEK